MEMEIDDDDMFDEDQMETFLKHKLKNIKAVNRHLAKTVDTIKDTIAQLETNECNDQSVALMVGATSKRFHNGKWCFIVEITSSETSITYKNFDVSFNWTPIIAPQYTLMVHSTDGFVTETRLECGTRIIITFESITFIKHKTYEADAMLFCNNAENYTSKLRIKLPKFQLDVDELNSGDLEIKNINLINNQQDAILTALACSTQIKLAMTLSMGVLKDYLVIDCMCRELFLRDGSAYFLLNGNSDNLNGCIFNYVEENGIVLVHVYVRNKEHLQNVLHYLHGNIRGVRIMPLRCKLQLEKQASERGQESDDEIFPSQQAYLQSQQPKHVDADVKKFGEFLLRQIDSVIDFHRNVVGNKDLSAECDVTDEYQTLRNSLTQLEFSTDTLHEKFSH